MSQYVPLQPPTPQQSPRKKLTPQQRRKRKVRKAMRIGLVVTVFALVLVVAGTLGYAVWLNSQIQRNTITKDDSALGIDDKFQDKKYDDITNIALFGVDRRGNTVGRSDAIMVLTIDRKRNKMKATSLLRDSYVMISGRSSSEKLAHAYAYGGPELAIQTINQNFGLNIRDYITVDFDSMAKIVDAVGGVTIDVKANEIASANESIREYCAVYEIASPTYIRQAGVQTLNGMQACGYSRVRYAGNGDDRQRTDRQRRVIEQVFEQVKSISPLQYPALASKLVPLIETSLSTTDILGLGTSVMKSGTASFDQMRFPMNVDLIPKRIDGADVLTFDLTVTQQKIHDFLFDDIKPE